MALVCFVFLQARVFMNLTWKMCILDSKSWAKCWYGWLVEGFKSSRSHLQSQNVTLDKDNGMYKLMPCRNSP